MLSIRDPRLRERFEGVRQLGAGSFGTVFEVFDHGRGCAVALKTLEQGGARALFRFKREFRSLAGIVHPNLIVYHELFSDDDRWFFTMELVHGVDFRSWVEGSSAARHAEAHRRTLREARATVREAELGRATLLEAVQQLAGGAGGGTVLEAPATRTRELDVALLDEPAAVLATAEPVLVLDDLDLVERALDEERLRAALVQLAAGLDALHAAGKLHRDLKPSNVLVTADGRVVILDFGVVAELDDDATDDSRHPSLDVVGTPAYMAPEQILGRAPTHACDWYALGVMLYEALTGQVPFAGSLQEVFEQKVRFDARSRLARLPDAPRDLVALCTALLAEDPAARPDGVEVLARLRAASDAAARATLPPGLVDVVGQTSPLATLPQQPRRARHGATSSHHATGEAGAEVTGITRLTSVLRPRGSFVGRDAALGALHRAFADTLRGSTRMVVVRGDSGVGKSALVRRFVEQVRAAHPDVVVLTGQCYEQESVPFKAVDGVVDALSRMLRELDLHLATALLPAGIHDLARIFPVLRQVPAVRGARRRVLGNDDPRELRRRAFGALCELFTRMAHHAPVLVFIDDLQWGDADSAAPLERLVLSDPDAPPILLVATFRDDTASTPGTPGSLLDALDEAAQRAGARVAGRLAPLALGPLASDEATALALDLLGGTREGHALAELVAAESGGNPLFIHELVEYAGRSGAGEVPRAPDLDAVLRERLAAVPPAARRLVELVAVAGRPLDRQLALEAAGIRESAGASALRGLVAARLVRVLADGRGSLVPYHDRIRQSLVASLDDERRRAHHRSLAAVLGDEAPEMLVASADHAWQALAFERAARLYGQALARETSPGARQRLLLKLAEALIQDGRGPEAVAHLCAAADTLGAEAHEACELRLRAADQLFRAARIDEGLALAARALAAQPFGLRLPASPARLVAAVAAARTRLKLRRPRPQASAEPPAPARLSLLRGLFGLVSTLLTIAPLEMVLLHHHHLALAMATDAPWHRALALACEAVVATVFGARHDHVEALVARAEHHARVLEAGERERALGHVAFLHAASELLAGHLEAAELGFARAEDRLLEHLARALASRRSDRSQVTGLRELPQSPAALRAGASGSPEFVALRALRQTCDLWRGAWGRLRDEHHACFEGYLQRGHQLAACELAVRGGWLATLLDAGRGDDARRLLEHALATWHQTGRHPLQVEALLAHARIDLYEGHASAAWQRLEPGWRELEGDRVMRLAPLRLEAVSLHALTALAAARSGALAPAAAQRLAQRHARSLRKEDSPWARALAEVVEACARADSGAAGDLASAEVACRNAGLAAWAAACAARRAEALGQTPEPALAFFASQGAHEPARCVAMLLG